MEENASWLWITSLSGRDNNIRWREQAKRKEARIHPSLDWGHDVTNCFTLRAPAMRIPYHDRLYRELGVRKILLFKVAFARWLITQQKLKHTCSTDPNYLPGSPFTPRAISFILTPVSSISKAWENGDLERSSNIYELLLIMHSQSNKFIVRNQVWGLWDQGKKREE